MRLRRSLVISEEKQPVLDDGTTERTTVLVLEIGVQILGEPGKVGLKIVSRLKMLVGMEFVNVAMELVGAGLNLYVDGGSASHALLGVK